MNVIWMLISLCLNWAYLIVLGVLYPWLILYFAIGGSFYVAKLVGDEDGSYKNRDSDSSFLMGALLDFPFNCFWWFILAPIHFTFFYKHRKMLNETDQKSDDHSPE